MYLYTGYIRFLGAHFIYRSNIIKVNCAFKNAIGVRNIFTSCVPFHLTPKVQYDPIRGSNIASNKNNDSFSNLVLYPENCADGRNKIIVFDAKSFTVVSELNLTSDLYEVDDFLLTQEFKTVLSSNLFHYDVSVVNFPVTNSQQFLSPCLTSFSPCHSSIIYSDFSLFTLNNDSLCSDSSKPADTENQPNKPNEDQLLKVSNHLTYSLLNFFQQLQDFSIYRKDIIFQNNINGIRTRGISDYKKQLYLFKIYGHLCYAKVKVEILKITHHLDDGTVRVRWRINGVSRAKIISQFLSLKLSTWKDYLNEESEWIDGFSVFNVDQNGLVFKHFCDKMIPDNEAKTANVGSIRTRILALLGLSGRPPLGGMQAITYSSQSIHNLKMSNKS